MARKDTLYVTDMDGTLLGADSRLSEESREIISDLSRRGYLITVATARTPATVVPLLEGTFTLPPAIVITGGALWDRGPRPGYSHVRYIEPALYASLTDIFSRCGLSPFVYTLPRYEAGETPVLQVYRSPGIPMNRAEESFVDERRGLRLKKFHIGTPPPPPAADTTLLFFGMGPLARVLEAADIIGASGLECTVSAYPDIFLKDTGLLEVFPAGVSKAGAVRDLAQRLGAQRTVVFGDNLNDLPMMGVADVAVAVENALPEVKAAASVVIGPNTASSVARYIALD